MVRWQTQIGSFAVIAMTIGAIGCSHPSDASLAALLDTKEATFQEARKMLMEDRDVVCVASYYYNAMPNRYETRLRASSALSSSRWSEYTLLLRSLSIDGSMCKDMSVDGTIRGVLYPMSSRGFVFGGSSKGICYSEHEPKPVQDSLDGTALGFKRVRDKWYIYQSGN